MDLLSEQLQAGFSETTFVLKPELDNILRLESQSRDITFTILGLPSFIEDGEISESDIQAYYQANPVLFRSDPQTKIEYLELSVKELAKNIESDEEILRNFYNDNKADYDIVEQRSVSKLFVNTGEKAPDEIIAKAKTIITSALEQVNNGDDFEEIVERAPEEKEVILEFSEFSESEFLAADLDENGQLDILDIVSIVNIIISDDGSGFSKDIIDKLGEPYVSKNKQGMGLGIFIAKNLIENMGGNLDFYNSKEGNAVVEITFDNSILNI